MKPVLMARMEDNLEFILSHPLVERFQFVTPAEAIALLRGRAPSAERRGVRSGSPRW